MFLLVKAQCISIQNLLMTTMNYDVKERLSEFFFCFFFF